MLKNNKKDEINEEIIPAVKFAVTDFCKEKDCVKSVRFEETERDGLSRFSAIIEYDDFEQEIYCYPCIDWINPFIDAQFSFENSEYRYSIYDIFNLFDINDFKLYHYTCVSSFDDAGIDVTEILEATEKYYDYFVKAQELEYLFELEKNYEKDMENTAGEYWKDHEKDEYIIPENHIELSPAGSHFKSKNIKKLRRKSKNGTLELIYEKRFLDYLESGNTPEGRTDVIISDFNRYKIIINIILFVLAALCTFAGIYLAARQMYGPLAAAERIDYNLFNSAVCALSAGAVVSIWLTKLILKPVLVKKHGREAYDDCVKNDFFNKSNMLTCVFATIIFGGWFYLCLKAVLF